MSFEKRNFWPKSNLIMWYTLQQDQDTLGGIASICFRFNFLQTLRCTPRGVRGVIKSVIMWEIQKCLLPGRPSSQSWIKSKTIYHILMNFEAFLTVFYSILAGWSTWQWLFLYFSKTRNKNFKNLEACRVVFFRKLTRKLVKNSRKHD